MKDFGKSETEKKVEDTLTARKIVREIMDFGVSQQQILRIAYLLCLELEDNDTMVTTSTVIKDFLGEISPETKSDIIV